MVDKQFVATKAFIMYENKVLIVKESVQYQDGTNAGLFDVVGGRIEPGQAFAESLLREIEEETGLRVKIGRPFYVGEWRPQVRGEEWQIIGTFFECVAESDSVQLSADHSEYRWIDPADYHQYELIANLQPVFESYLELKRTEVIK
ncbi:MAG: NUDIX domain-containing protein [Candidatus Komeilibacteria bacterium]|nr:NUDIX domain-containing protein [Candidatus Komeilibacteria bacterium]